MAGGVFETYDPDDYPVRLFDFEYPMSKNDFETIVATPYGFCTFAQNGQQPRKGRINEIQYNRVKGVASITLKTNKATIDAN